MKEKEVKTFGSRVRSVRKHLKLTQVELCKDLGITSQHLSDIESDRNRPCHDFFFNMLNLYRVNVNFLLNGEGEMFLGEKKEEISPGIIQTGNLEIDTYLYYFFTDDMVRYNALFYFSKLCREEKINLDQPLFKKEEKEKAKP